MNAAPLMFYFFEVMAGLSALSLIFTRNVFYGALLLIVCLLSLAGIYVLAFAEFIAVTQILIYAGGILVVIIFGIMLTSKISGKPLVVQHTNWFSGALASAAFLGILLYLLSQHSFHTVQASPNPSGNPLHQIGTGLMSRYVLPFEMAGILLLIALVGAAVIASSAKPKKL